VTQQSRGARQGDTSGWELYEISPITVASL
jgi:hypothetical protein